MTSPRESDTVASTPTGKRVLLVEDNIDAVEIYGSSLRFAGYEVVAALTIEEATASVREQCPDVVILDCRLPDGDGLALLERWRRSSAMASVPVIVVTASGVRQDVEAALFAGADVFVPKPCSGNVLAMHVANALSGKRASARLRRGAP